MEIRDDLIRQLRLECNLTQAQRGSLLGVQEAQLSKLENNAANVSTGTLLSVLKAVSAKAYLKVELPDPKTEAGFLPCEGISPLLTYGN